jgi:hypothetical protein
MLFSANILTELLKPKPLFDRSVYQKEVYWNPDFETLYGPPQCAYLLDDRRLQVILEILNER